MSVVHSFDIAHAAMYGVEEAVFINNMAFWIAKNKANARHLYDGRTWTYNSIKAFGELFPYLSEKQIRRVLESLVRHGVIMKGNYNDQGYDRTLWYAFVDESIFLNGHLICPNGQMEAPKRAKRNAQKGEPIPDGLPDSYTDGSKNNTPPASADDETGKPLTAKDLKAKGVDPQHVADFLATRKAKRAPLTVTALAGIEREATAAGLTLAQAIQISAERGWQGFKAEWLHRDTPQSSRPASGKPTLAEQNRAAAEAARKLLFGDDPVEA
ncbi:hypothetical protein [Chromobacterium violaceum]|uniref:hypothetical protein n=1 Tax=Chromobacterium violaceum TaxID=536 RepID=UPI001C8C4124|nr:hypothetical protein [Chromobacterium violaceum]MBX9267228.1 hypothetical protein [Chromobacterium violaceum]